MSSSFLFKDPSPAFSDAEACMQGAYHMPEEESVKALLQHLSMSSPQNKIIEQQAENYVEQCRKQGKTQSLLDQFLRTYDLSTKEGVVLMCVAEALLRIPDKKVQDDFLKDKLTRGQWKEHIQDETSWAVNAGTWALMLSGQLLDMSDANAVANQFFRNTSTPVIRKVMLHAMQILGRQFVTAESIEEALSRSEEKQNTALLYSFDMLGEAAKTKADADRYFEDYRHAIQVISRHAPHDDLRQNPGISIKLSALHPRYEYGQKPFFYKELREKLQVLVNESKAANIPVTIDAEEANRLEISLELFRDLYMDQSLKGWAGLGLAVQAYQKRAPYVIHWLEELAQNAYETEGAPRPIMIRLVKGAYWDSEIKHAQQSGVDDYPVFTRKESTDISYMVCAQKIFEAGEEIFYPQLATHNAHTISFIQEVATHKNYEFQRLHGMGQDLYEHVSKHAPQPVRLYAPVGSYNTLLPYLVRRLLENGANTSFVNRLHHDELPPRDLVKNPVETLKAKSTIRHDGLPKPLEIFAPRHNSKGIELSDTHELYALKKEMEVFKSFQKPSETNVKELAGIYKKAAPGFVRWSETSAEGRTEALLKAADLLEEAAPDFYAIIIEEAHKTLADAIAEVREAVDFIRYYAHEVQTKYAAPQALPGPTGEENLHTYEARGIWACISPWNFPLAIFTGQIAAALAMGNAVIAKPAEQTPAIGAKMIEVFHKAGVPAAALHLVVGDGKLGQALVDLPDIAGVAFTGSTDVARKIQKTLTAKSGPIIPLIAETGGQNACIVDSTALLEQVVDDVVTSAFLSAGQRCSAMRMLYVQDEIYTPLIKMLSGAMETLVVGNPRYLSTDLGPVIDEEAATKLNAHLKSMKSKTLYQTPVPKGLGPTYIPPTLIEVTGIEALKTEHFGPILHVARYKSKDLDQVIQHINSAGYGLTAGIHTRIESKAQEIATKLKVGNVYVNRNMVGAVVGSQPFGGRGLSGTGPKAGGPDYLKRFATEKAVSTDTTAAGGNASLLGMLD